MGIGNDITPKIKKTVETKIEVQPEKIDEPDKDPGQIEVPIDRTGIHKPVYEDIFHDHHNPFEHLDDDSDSLEHEKEKDFQSFFADKSKQTPTPHKKSHWFIYIIIVLVVGFFALLAYQNYDTILKKLGISDNTQSTNSSNSSSDKGVEIINGQDYTDSTNDANSNANNAADANAQASADTNTTPAASTTTPATTPQTTTIERSTISLRVLNGNGISGSAASVKDKLVAAGYTVGKVTNASKFTYVNTTLYYNTGKEAAAKQIAADLSDRTTSLFENPQVTGSNDVIVVVGKN